MTVAFDDIVASSSNDRPVAEDLANSQRLGDEAATEGLTGPPTKESPASSGCHYVSESKAEIEFYS